jgi:hypothetical protein
LLLSFCYLFTAAASHRPDQDQTCHILLPCSFTALASFLKSLVDGTGAAESMQKEEDAAVGI